MRTAHKVRAYPDPAQAALLSRTFGCVRLVWNKTLADRQRRYTVKGRSTPHRETDAALAGWKKAGDLRYQRMTTRRQKGSNNRAKARIKAARAHSRARDARRDFLRKTSTELVTRFDRVGIEDLNVSGMVGNRRLSKVISRCGWAEFRDMLEYRAERAGRQFVVVNRWYPSSRTCSDCGYLLATLSLGTRCWTCPGCGTRHDRDHNAAKNIDTAAGLAVAALERT